MNVTRGQIVSRGLRNCCPNCGAPTLFVEGSPLRVRKQCPQCSFRFERDNDEAFFLGSMSLNYGVTIICFLVPVLLLYLGKVIGGMTAAIAAGVGAIGFPILFYRSSRSWWLMYYYFFLPHHLPANGGKGRGDD